MNRGLIFAAAVAGCVLAAGGAAAQDVRADEYSVAIGGNVTSSTIIIGARPEELAALARQSTDLSETQKKLITRLEGALDLKDQHIRVALRILGEANVEPGSLEIKLIEVAQRYKDLLAGDVDRPGDPPKTKARKAKEQQALDAGDLDKVDESLAAAEAEERQASERAAVNLAETSAKRGDLAMTRLRYGEAAKHFANAAAAFVPGGPHENERIRYLEKEADALFQQGDYFGDNGALAAAIERYRALIPLKSRERVPLKWAGVQDRLGRTLARLGERESGTEHLEAALAAYAQAQKEFTRERKPGRWAMIESHRGFVLGTIGVRESGTARLDEAVVVYREVLKVLKRERSPLPWAAAQLNLGVALERRGERSRGTRRLKAAVAAYHKSLEVYTREKHPLTWATLHNNLGIAFDRLGQREEGTARLEEAIAAYHEALEEWTRERVPTRWAGAHNGIANALVKLGRRENGTARLEEAIAAYDEALKERTPERTPIDWARTSGSQGVALMLLAERTNNLEMAKRAVAQIEAALEMVRGGRHAPREASFSRDLLLARDLVQRLRQP